MLRNLRKCLVLMALVSLFLGAPGVGLACVITLDARQDAGEYPGVSEFLGFAYGDNYENFQYVPTPSTPWTSSQPVYEYAAANIPGAWLLHSAGNVWTSDPAVGESLLGLHSGTYRISALSGAFTYDSFGWSPNTDYLWHLDIKVQQGAAGDISYYTLDSIGNYIDISLVDGGSLYFWINDWNSIDNLGEISFNVAAVPEPSTLLLLGSGLVLLARRIRR
jgi:hypothetical protein